MCNIKTKEEYAIKVINNYLLSKKKKAPDKTNEGFPLIYHKTEDALNEIKTYKTFQRITQTFYLYIK